MKRLLAMMFALFIVFVFAFNSIAATREVPGQPKGDTAIKQNKKVDQTKVKQTNSGQVGAAISKQQHEDAKKVIDNLK